jgi:hypothetical protein
MVVVVLVFEGDTEIDEDVESDELVLDGKAEDDETMESVLGAMKLSSSMATPISASRVEFIAVGGAAEENWVRGWACGVGVREPGARDLELGDEVTAAGVPLGAASTADDTDDPEPTLV